MASTGLNATTTWRWSTSPGRYIRNKHLADACYLWAFAALTKSAGARAYYDRRRGAGDRHNAADDGRRPQRADH